MVTKITFFFMVVFHELSVFDTFVWAMLSPKIQQGKPSLSTAQEPRLKSALSRVLEKLVCFYLTRPALVAMPSQSLAKLRMSSNWDWWSVMSASETKQKSPALASWGGILRWPTSISLCTENCSTEGLSSGSTSYGSIKISNPGSCAE